MRFALKRRPTEVLPGLIGTAKVGRSLKSLLSRLKPGDVAVIHHEDLDRDSALALVQARVAAVVNATPMISGRFPALGPQVLVDAGIVVIDRVGRDGFSSVRDGEKLRLHDGRLFRGQADTALATGRVVDGDLLADELAAARVGMATQLDAFNHHSSAFFAREQDTLLHGLGIPRTATRLRGRPCVIALAGPHHVRQLHGLRRYIREQRPVLIGVDRGADALRNAGHQPEIVICTQDGSADLPTAATLSDARDVVAVSERGSSGAAEKLAHLGVRVVPFEMAGTAEDAALLLAHAAEASVIVGVGLHGTLEQFLDRQRAGQASTWLTRLKVGPVLVDATVVPQLYAGQLRPRHLIGVVAAGLVALAAAVSTTPAGAGWSDQLFAAAHDLMTSVQGLFS